MGFPGGSVDEVPSCNAVVAGNGFDFWVGKISWRRAQQPTPVFLPGDTHEEPDRGAWWAMVHRSQNQTRLKHLSIAQQYQKDKCTLDS